MALACVNMKVVGTAAGQEVSRDLPTVSVTGLTTLNTDVTTALAVAGGAHDSTPEITTIQTDIAALVNVISIAGDVCVLWNTTTVTDVNTLRLGMRKAMNMIASSTVLTA